MSIIVRDNSLQNFPPGYVPWKGLHERGHQAVNAGFAVSNAELFRFLNRYKVAQSFRGINLDGFNSPTVDGYSALFRVMLVWSAFERFLVAIGLRQKDSTSLLVPYEPAKHVREVRKADYEARLFSFVRKHADKKPTQDQLDDFLQGRDCNPTYLASSLRHIFAHGWLTPHAGRTNPERVARVCGLVCDFHMNVMDGEFERRVSSYAQSTSAAG